MSIHENARLLVTGANGNLGRATVKNLLLAGATNVVAGSRNTDLISDLADEGAKTIPVDFHEPHSLAASFQGIDRALIISLDARQGSAEERVRGQLSAVEAAAAAKVSRIVYTSMHKPEPGSLLAIATTHYQTEQAIEQSKIPFSILRVNSYANNIFYWLPPILASGRWITAAGDGRTAYIDRLDVARVAATALTGAPDLGRINVSGPEALTASDVVPLLKEVFDISVDLIHVTDDERESGLIAAGVPTPIAKNLAALDATTRSGAFDTANDAVSRLTGTPPRTFAEFLRANREALLAAAKR